MTDGNLSKFFEELRLGNPELQEPFDRYLQALATTVINIRMIFDSPIILGGYVGAYSEYFVDRLRQLVV